MRATVEAEIRHPVRPDIQQVWWQPRILTNELVSRVTGLDGEAWITGQVVVAEAAGSSGVTRVIFDLDFRDETRQSTNLSVLTGINALPGEPELVW